MSAVLPLDPGSVTTAAQREFTSIDREAECDPRDVGLTAANVERIWHSVQRFYGTGLHPAVTIVLRRHGKVLLKRAIGHRDTDGADPLDSDAPQCLFSASKAISALLLHRLVDDGKLELDDAVAEYVPEFATNGKHQTTIRDLLAHRSGVPFIPPEHKDPELLRDWDTALQLICDAAPFDKGRKIQAYHALTGGFVVGEIVRRVGGIELNDALQRWIAEPLGCRHMSYGADAAMRPHVAENAVTGPKIPWPLSSYLKRIVHVPFEEAVNRSNEDAFMSSIIPSGNIYASADDLCRVYQMLLDGGLFEGQRVLSESSIRDARRPVGRLRVDRTLLFPLRFSAGFMLGSHPIGLFGPKSGDSFGHLGFLNILGWADPNRDIAVALLNTGKTMAPINALRLFQILASVNHECRTA